jgi:hypothetical protein
MIFKNSVPVLKKTQRVSIEDQLVHAVEENEICLFLKSLETHKYTPLGKYKVVVF